MEFPHSNSFMLLQTTRPNQESLKFDKNFIETEQQLNTTREGPNESVNNWNESA